MVESWLNSQAIGPTHFEYSADSVYFCERLKDILFNIIFFSYLTLIYIQNKAGQFLVYLAGYIFSMKESHEIA